MPKGRKTSVFVSSTCYDLSQIRNDLHDFFVSLGHLPVLSDYKNFPIDPDLSTFDNCLEAVKNNADIYVLIVGGRYGSVANNGKSITNLEFNTAKSKGIPKYIFISQNVLTLLPIWKDNPDSDFSSSVDSNQIFEFITELYKSGNSWVFPFNNGQDIVATLKTQFSYLLSDCLHLKQKFSKFDHSLNILSGKPLKIAVEKADYWEFLLVSELLGDLFDKCNLKKIDAELGISFEEPIVLENFEEVRNWISTRISSISSIMENLTKNMNNGYAKAVGEPGEEGDLIRIIHWCSRFRDAYIKLLDWRLQFENVEVEDEFQKVVSLASEFSLNAITELEEFVHGLSDHLNATILKAESEGAFVESAYTLTLTAPNTDEFHKEMIRLKEIYL